MKNIIFKREGQISIGLAAAVAGGIIVAVMGGMALWGASGAVKKTDTAELNAGGKNAVASLACNSASADYPNCLTAPQYLPSQTDLNAKVQGGFLNSIGNTLLPAAEFFKNGINFVENGIVSAYKKVANFWEPLPIAPIDLKSVPSSPAPAPKNSIPFPAATSAPAPTCSSKYYACKDNCDAVNAYDPNPITYAKCLLNDCQTLRIVCENKGKPSVASVTCDLPALISQKKKACSDAYYAKSKISMEVFYAAEPDYIKCLKDADASSCQ